MKFMKMNLKIIKNLNKITLKKSHSNYKFQLLNSNKQKIIKK